MRLSLLPAALLCCALAFQPTLHAQDTPDYKSNPKFQAAIAEAKQLQKQRQIFFAIEAYKKANKIAAGKDADCLRALLDLQMNSGSYKDAAATAASLEAIATSPIEKSRAESDHGYALFLQAGDKNKPDLFRAADAASQSRHRRRSQERHRTLPRRLRPRSSRPERRRIQQFKQCLAASPPTTPATSAPSTSPKTPNSPPTKWPQPSP